MGYLCTAALIGRDPLTPPPLPPNLGSYTRALLVGQDRVHLSSSSDLILSVDDSSLLPESILPNVLQMPTTEMRKEASTGLISLDSASVGRYLRFKFRK
jgi:hypothetical protein